MSTEPQYSIQEYRGRLYLVPEEFVEAFLDIATDCQCWSCRQGARRPLIEELAIPLLGAGSLVFENPRFE